MDQAKQDVQFGMVDMTNEEYHSGPGVSKSHLDAIAGKSPKHYWHRYLNPDRERQDPTPALVIGAAIHCAILEPDDFMSRYVGDPGISRRSNAGKEEFAAFQSANAGKIILPDDGMQTCLAIRDAVHTHPVAGPLMSNGRSEQTFVALDPDTGEVIKCRTDWMIEGRGLIVDVKSTEDASPAEFGKSVANYRYTLQPPWYCDVIEAAVGEAPPYWAFLAVEKSPPYAIGIYTPTAPQIAHGREVARRDFEKIIACKRENIWPDYGAEVLPLDLPGWMKL